MYPEPVLADIYLIFRLTGRWEMHNYFSRFSNILWRFHENQLPAFSFVGTQHYSCDITHVKLLTCGLHTIRGYWLSPFLRETRLNGHFSLVV